MFPPMLLYVRVVPPEKAGFGVWLPLFLVWLILLPLVVLVLVITMIVDVALILAGESYHDYTVLLVRCLGLLGASRGTSVHVHSGQTNVDIELV